MQILRTAFSSALMIALVLTASGCRRGSSNISIDGVDGPHVSYNAQQVSVSMTFKSLQIDGGLTLPIPDHPNSTISLGPDQQSGGTLLRYTVAVTDLGTSLNMQPMTLPGGRPLPGVANGSLPGLSFEVPQVKNSVFYVSKENVGFFIHTDFLKMQNAIITMRLNDSQGKYMGTVSAVGPDTSNQNAGILVMLNIDSVTGDAIRTIHQRGDIRSIFNPIP